MNTRTTKIHINHAKYHSMKDIFAERNTVYDLRHGNDSQFPKVHTPTYGNRLWSTLPNKIKQASTLPIFKSHIKCWKGENCNCRLCIIYIPQVGYLLICINFYFTPVIYFNF